MPNKLSCKCLVSILVLIGLVVSAQPLVNSWTNPMSASWEGGTNWSLGQFPASNQSVMITNAGYKAVGISLSTVTNFPASMTVSNLTVSAPANALSTLLLNYSGTATPLRVLNGCTVGTNGSLDNFYGAFEVDSGQWNITNGQFNQEGGTTVATNATTSVIGGGSMNLTNVEVNLGTLFVGIDAETGTNSGSATQAGGFVDCNLFVEAGSYSLLRGSFSGGCTVSGSSSPTFNQYGGTNYADISIGDYSTLYPPVSRFGTYTLYDGAVIASSVQIGNATDIANGEFNQANGFVSIASLSMGGFLFYERGSYSMTNGILLTGSIGFGNGSIDQEGGQHITTNTLYLIGHVGDYGEEGSAGYGLSGGTLFCPGIVMGIEGSFYQSGGTNTVAGNLSFTGSSYNLSSGTLLTSNSTVEGPYIDVEIGAVIPSQFMQTGGEHHVSNTLTDDDQYFLWGGTLTATNIVLRGFLAVSNTAVILNPGLFDFGGQLQLYNANENLGRMLLSSNSRIDLEPGAHTLVFQNSSSSAWGNGWTLTISNWTGLTNGGGSFQLLFGNNSSGLTQAQVGQIQFANPAGFPAGVYPATMLDTGEVVPTLWQRLRSSQNPNGLVFNWSGSYVLQTATNVEGPYSDVTGATSPYTNFSFQLPREFFRLRQ